MLPPYEGIDTLLRLSADISATAPRTVVCLGDSFDDAAAAHALDEVTTGHLTPLMAGRSWIWIEGNHDPGPPSALAGRIWRRCARAPSPSATSPGRTRRARSRATTTPRHASPGGGAASRGPASWSTGCGS